MPTTPARVQRTRKAGGGMPPGSRYVGRGTKWGNPWRIVRHADGLLGIPDPVDSLAPWPTFAFETEARAEAVRLYRAWLGDRPALAECARRELRGLDLACWCPLPAEGERDHCHAAVLIEWANRPA